MVPDWLKHPRWKAVRPPLGVAVLAVDFPAAKRAESWMIETWRNALARWRDWRGS